MNRRVQSVISSRTSRDLTIARFFLLRFYIVQPPHSATCFLSRSLVATAATSAAPFPLPSWDNVNLNCKIPGLPLILIVLIYFIFFKLAVYFQFLYLDWINYLVTRVNKLFNFQDHKIMKSRMKSVQGTINGNRHRLLFKAIDQGSNA